MDRVDLPGEDRLSGMLREIRVRSVVYCLSDFTAPWGFRVERSPVAKFHLMLEGAATLMAADLAPVPLASGDLVLLPHGEAHAIANEPDSAAPKLDAILADLCGAFELDPALPDELAEFLPPLLTLDSKSGPSRWVEPMFSLLEEETRASAPGAAAIFAKLADVFVAAALRSYLVAADGMEQIALPAQPDPGIVRVVTQLRSRPEARWSVDAMASSAGMSRTSFNTRFRANMGQAPMAFLTELRLRRAAGYLSTTTKGLREIAHLSGYEDDASFSKAFSRLFGRPPGEYRRGMLAVPQQASR
jgi:AraC family transcriptional regulator, alkane utilization regulator